MKEQDKEARAREVLAAHAGYEISRWDVQENCSVLARDAITAMIAFTEQSGAGEQSALCERSLQACAEWEAVAKLLDLIETAHEHGDEIAIVEQAETVRALQQGAVK